MPVLQIESPECGTQHNRHQGCRSHRNTMPEACLAPKIIVASQAPARQANRLLHAARVSRGRRPPECALMNAPSLHCMPEYGASKASVFVTQKNSEISSRCFFKNGAVMGSNRP